MPLPRGFLFTANNLQDFTECQRRFQLRAMNHLIWPSVEVEPHREYERMANASAQFHKLVRQYLNGIGESQVLQATSDAPELQSWINNYLQSMKDGVLKQIFTPHHQRFEEVTLSIPIDDFHLSSKYDLILTHPDGKVTILDLLTSQIRPDRKWLEDRLQTHVDPLVLYGASANLIGKAIKDSSQIELIYWFASFPEEPERFLYDQATYESDTATIKKLISSIDQKTEPIFPLTPDRNRCAFCAYRSFCGTGVKPGEFKEWSDWLVMQTSDASINDLEPARETEHQV